MCAYPAALREQVIAGLEQGWSAQRLARAYALSPRTVRRWRVQWRSLGQRQARIGPGRRRLIGAHHDALLAAQVRQQPSLTLAEHCQLWHAQTGVQVSVTTMSRSIRRLGWTRQAQPPGHQ